MLYRAIIQSAARSTPRTLDFEASSREEAFDHALSEVTETDQWVDSIVDIDNLREVYSAREGMVDRPGFLDLALYAVTVTHYPHRLQFGPEPHLLVGVQVYARDGGLAVALAQEWAAENGFPTWALCATKISFLHEGRFTADELRAFPVLGWVTNYRVYESRERALDIASM